MQRNRRFRSKNDAHVFTIEQPRVRRGRNDQPTGERGPSSCETRWRRSFARNRVGESADSGAAAAQEESVGTAAINWPQVRGSRNSWARPGLLHTIADSLESLPSLFPLRPSFAFLAGSRSRFHLPELTLRHSSANRFSLSSLALSLSSLQPSFFSFSN